MAACETAGAVRSMSRLDYFPGSAAMEGFSWKLKVELFYGCDWFGWTAGRFERRFGKCVFWYNAGRFKWFRSLDWAAR